MDSKSRRAREVQTAIDSILLDEWNPIGVEKEILAPDEYSRYVGPVYHALVSGASEEEIASVLAKIELESFGHTISTDRLIDVARRLRALDVRLG